MTASPIKNIIMTHQIMNALTLAKEELDMDIKMITPLLPLHH